MEKFIIIKDLLPVIDWIMDLPKPIALRVIKQSYIDMVNTKASSRQEALSRCLVFRNTEEGNDYWLYVWNDLNLANNCHGLKDYSAWVLEAKTKRKTKRNTKPAKHREHWVGQKGTAPGGAVVKIMEINGRGHLRADAIWLFPESKLWYNMALYQSITWEESHEV